MFWIADTPESITVQRRVYHGAAQTRCTETVKSRQTRCLPTMLRLYPNVYKKQKHNIQGNNEENWDIEKIKLRMIKSTSTKMADSVLANQKQQKNDKPNDTIDVRVRNVNCSTTKNDNTFKMIQVRGASTATDIKQAVITELQRSWKNQGYELQHEDIVVFRVDRNKEKEEATMTTILKDGDDLFAPSDHQQQDSTMANEGEERKEDSSAETYFVALEYFTRLPEDLLRTVPVDALFPNMYTHPDYVGSWTRMSPLYCAEFVAGERAFPWYSVKFSGEKGRDFKAHGVSLRRPVDGEEVSDLSDPFGELGPQEKKGVTVMALETYKRLAGDHCDPDFGILRTKLSHMVNSLGNFERYPREDILIAAQGNAKQKKSKLATKRDTYVRFNLKKGLDLAPYGVAVVYDSSSPGHVSLVRTSDTLVHRNYRDWEKHATLRVHLPLDCHDKVPNARENPGEFTSFVKKEVLKVSNDKPEPECFDHWFRNKHSLVLPKVRKTPPKMLETSKHLLTNFSFSIIAFPAKGGFIVCCPRSEAGS